MQSEGFASASARIIIILVLGWLLLLSGCDKFEELTGSGSSDDPPTGQSLNLSWDAPTSNSDGSTLTDLAGFNIYRGIETRNYQTVISAGPATQFTVHSLEPGTYHFAVTALDLNGNESDLSEELVATVEPPE